MKRILLVLVLMNSVYAGGGDPKQKKQTPLIFKKLGEKIVRPDIYLPRMVEKALLKRKFNKYMRKSSDLASSATQFDTNKRISSVLEFGEYLQLIKNDQVERKDCSEVCPKDFRILDFNRSQLKRDASTHLGILNLDDDFADWRKKTIGYCWGYSATLGDFQHLLLFDPENLLEQDVPASQAERIEMYKSLLKTASVKNEAVVVPEIGSIRELTSIPELKMELMKLVGNRWALNATHVQSVANMFIDDVAMSPAGYTGVVNELKGFLARGIMPRIIFADDSPGAMGNFSHVVNVNKVESYADGSHKIFLNETNYYPEDDGYETYHIEITPQGTAHYEPLLRSSRIAKKEKPYDRVGKIKLSHEFKRDMAKYVKSLHKMCKRVTRCQ